jgi:hypothetical protein
MYSRSNILLAAKSLRGLAAILQRLPFHVSHCSAECRPISHLQETAGCNHFDSHIVVIGKTADAAALGMRPFQEVSQ